MVSGGNLISYEVFLALLISGSGIVRLLQPVRTELNQGVAIRFVPVP